MAPAADSHSELVREVAERSSSRLDLWATFIGRTTARTVAEIGVYRGAFAAHVLERCPSIETYYMVDPWQHLDDWNKPANRDDETFERIFAEAMHKTRDHEPRRVVLRGRTTEVIGRIPDNSLDFAYVDGDHTLRGITIDLARVHGKVRPGGWIAGDDFSPTVWQHGTDFEPTLVFPYAVYFAEAVGARIYGLPYRQFLIEKQPESGFAFVDLTGKYGDLGLRGQLSCTRSAAPGALAQPDRWRSVRPLVQRVLRRSRRGRAG
jgi:predicted O-methyltransferase YrrM